MDDIAIAIKDICFSYPKKQIYSNLSLNIFKNNITYIMGNNGSGKTTLLKLMCQFLVTQSGIIEIFGKNISELDSLSFAKYVSYVPQTINQNVDFMVKDYLLMGRNPYLSCESINQYN